MTHLGQRLSALIDGELDRDERDRVLMHMARCGSCRDEVAALRMLKRRMNALGEAAAGAGLTGRLMSLREAALHDSVVPVEAAWPPQPDAAGWQPPNGSNGHESDDSDNRAARFFIAGSLAVFMLGLSTAAVVAGGGPQALAPAPPVRPSVDVFTVQRSFGQDSFGGSQIPASRKFTRQPDPGSPALTARLP
jgi:anti-sigma factor RsiW